jgi:CRP-like cAMP-binding protein
MAKLPLGLNHNELFASVFGDLADVRFATGEKLFSEGEPADYALYLLGGRASISVAVEDDVSAAIAERGAGELIGEMSLVTGVRCAGACALEPVSAVKVSYAVIAQLVNARPDFALALYSLATERLYEANWSLARCRSKRLKT